MGPSPALTISWTSTSPAAATSESAEVSQPHRHARRRPAQALIRIRRRLLADPLLHRANEPELWPAVLRYGADLARWFAVNLGWRLVVDSAGGFARLHKVAARPDPTRPARLNDTPLTPRKYTLLFLACAALLTSNRARPPCRSSPRTSPSCPRPKTPSPPSTRPTATATGSRSQVRSSGWPSTGSSPSVTATSTTTPPIRPLTRSSTSTTACSPTSCHAPPALRWSPIPPTCCMRSTQPARPGHRPRGAIVLRRLADDPLVYHDDLDAAERDWLGPRWQVANRLAAELGLTLERRAEGFTAIDRSIAEPMTDDRFPAAGSTVAHCALLLAEYLVDRHRAARVPEEGRCRPRARTEFSARRPRPRPDRRLRSPLRLGPMGPGRGRGPPSSRGERWTTWLGSGSSTAWTMPWS